MRLFSLGLVLAALAVAAPAAQAQSSPAQRHLVYFRDKTGTPYSVAQPQAFLSARSVQRRTRQGIAVLPRDLPVTPAYATQVRNTTGVRLLYTSRWFNAAVVECDAAALARLQALPFVRSATTLNRPAPAPVPAPPVAQQAAPAAARTAATAADYGLGYWQAQMLGAVSMHNAGYRGEGMQIAVFDAGFPGADQMAAFASLRQEGRLLSTFDFVDKDRGVFEKNYHGTLTLSTLAANQPGYFVGTAPKASYHLCITEDVSSEHPVEEANWLIAAEYADSLGVDVISSSLGYTTFDPPSTDHTYSELNGRTAIASRAATVAARVGMLVFNSAGNDGGGSWQYIGAPADADSVLTVGAVDSLLVRGGFSSIGPTADGRIKPDLSARGVLAYGLAPSNGILQGNGTSYACPILAGMGAGFWQANPTLTAQQVRQYLRSSGTQASNPDNLVGYGVPNFVRAYNLANPGAPLAAGAPRNPADELGVFPNPAGSALTLQLPEAFRRQALRVTVRDSRGALVSEQRLPAPGQEHVPLQLPALRAGAYTCTVEAGGQARTVRFVRQ
ncbi:S8 family serine peptidase [Hymenobacter sp. 15J16-1T3B]|uniref:S8 family serine peptidase n=1 Tax=Hymenobacter sp. 15J16-1T3B TaxID=2886941 RepID=UPI001D0F80DA|nr:S8 family serine peptidase [Hymenobacter sp. 15J16-1T3B]MCC3159079.1 S8 family serine peptidase [Hymenobacter sp. 15J16-1T3B]